MEGLKFGKTSQIRLQGFYTCQHVVFPQYRYFEVYVKSVMETLEL